MSKSQLKEFRGVEVKREIMEIDTADQAFWDEFWAQESGKSGAEPLFTITIKNQLTGEEKVVENVKLKFRNLKRLAD